MKSSIGSVVLCALLLTLFSTNVLSRCRRVASSDRKGYERALCLSNPSWVGMVHFSEDEGTYDEDEWLHTFNATVVEAWRGSPSIQQVTTSQDIFDCGVMVPRGGIMLISGRVNNSVVWINKNDNIGLRVDRPFFEANLTLARSILEGCPVND